MKKMIVWAAAVVALAGCGPETDTQLGVTVPVGQYQVSRVGVFPDELAYGGKRGIYVVKDSVTGQTFLGVSGVGISEVGSHSNGKSSTRDEQ